MRVIAGEARGRPLKGPKDAGTRPTADKVKGAVFSMLESLLSTQRGRELGASDTEEETAGIWTGLRVLDLYAGTGALGIEALSRGAERADFVDSNSGCQRLVKENLERTGLAGRGRVLGMAVQQALGRLTQGEPVQRYDVVLIDPPYGDPSLLPALETLAEGRLLAAQGLVVVEHSRRAAPADSYGELWLVKQRRYGDTEISIYEWRAGDTSALSR